MTVHHAILLPEKKLAYIPIPKSACTAVKVVLRRAIGLPDCAKPMDVHETAWPDILPVAEIPSGFKVFTVVRSPWTRLQSCWRDKICVEDNFWTLGEHGKRLRPHMPFGEFVAAVGNIGDTEANEHIRSQVDLLGGKCHLILRFEALEDSWWPIWTAYQLPCPKMTNVSRNRLSKESRYTDESRAIAMNRYAADATQFGYVWTQH